MARMSIAGLLDGTVVMAPMTKGSNLPYRRLCVELGARVTMSEMTVARRLKQKRRGEFALILATLAAQAGLDGRLAPFVAVYILALAVLGPVLALHASALSRIIPAWAVRPADPPARSA